MNEQTNDPQPLILAVETATRAGGVALARGEKILAAAEGDASVSHSTNLIEMIEQVLKQGHTKLTDVDLFAAAMGPGSFTGLRIGLATVKAFAVHLQKRIAGVSTLAAIAHAAEVKGKIISLLPAGRGEVFAQQFLVGDGEIRELDSAQHLSPRAVIEKYGGLDGSSLAGEGARMLEAAMPPGKATGNESLAPAIAGLAWRAYREGNLIAPEDLQAVYVRASDAEINERWQQQKAQPQG
jgi:tRNA threonylcarbamoyladenosine biosynthesis protein TsaB